MKYAKGERIQTLQDLMAELEFGKNIFISDALILNCELGEMSLTAVYDNLVQNKNIFYAIED